MWGLGFRVWGVGVRALGAQGFRVERGLGFESPWE